MLFFDPSSERPFPIFSESARFYHHPVAQVRTQVQATSLEIFSKLKSDEKWSDSIESLFCLVVADSQILFTHVCCLLRHYWRKAELRLQNDVLMYIMDVFTCDVPQLSAVLQERLLRFALLPLLGSALKLKEELSQELSWFLLLDVLKTLQHSKLPLLLAQILLRHSVTEEVLQLVVAPPRTPRAYFELQKTWGEEKEKEDGRQEGRSDGRSDQLLYESQVIRFASEPLVRNRLLERLLERIRELCEKGRVKEGTAALKSLLRLLEALKSQELLQSSVAEALVSCLSRCLARRQT